MIRRSLPILALCLSLVLAARDARAGGLVLSVSDAQLQPGGTAVVDVLISGDGLAALDSFSIVVRIAGAVDGRRLEFVAPGPGSMTDGQLSDPAHLLAGDSLFAGGVAGTLADEPDQNDTYIGGDGTISGLGVVVPTTPTLLTRLELTSLTIDAPIVGDHFEVFVDLLDDRTAFLDAQFNPIEVQFAAPGVISVVLEPSGMLLLTTGLAAVGLAGRRRPRRQVRERSESVS